MLCCCSSQGIKGMNLQHNVMPKHKRYENYVLLLSFAALFIIAGFRTVGFDGDSTNYSLLIEAFAKGDYYNVLLKEPFFWLILLVSKFLFTDVVRSVFVIFAFCGVSVKLYAIKRLSSYPILSLIVYICLYFILQEMTQIRVGVASGIFLLAIPDIINRNLKAFLIKTLIATLFHYSAIIMLLVYLLGSKKKQQVFYLFLPFLGILLAVLKIGETSLLFCISSLPGFLGSRLVFYFQLMKLSQHANINVFNILYSSLLIIYVFVIVNIRRLEKPIDILETKIFGWMLFSFYFFSFLPVVSFRISEFIGVVVILLFPSLLSMFRQKVFMAFMIIMYSAGVLIDYIFIQKLLNF